MRHTLKLTLLSSFIDNQFTTIKSSFKLLDLKIS